MSDSEVSNCGSDTAQFYMAGSNATRLDFIVKVAACAWSQEPDIFPEIEMQTRLKPLRTDDTELSATSCLICKTRDTPQWRFHKLLCNACGMRCERMKKKQGRPGEADGIVLHASAETSKSVMALKVTNCNRGITRTHVQKKRFPAAGGNSMLDFLPDQPSLTRIAVMRSKGPRTKVRLALDDYLPSLQLAPTESVTM